VLRGTGVFEEIGCFRELECLERLGTSRNWKVGRECLIQGIRVLGEIG